MKNFSGWPEYMYTPVNDKKGMNIRNRMNIRILCWERKSKHGVDFIQAEYKLKKERWKREMDNQDTPKSQRNQGTHEGKKEKKTIIH